MYFLEHLFLISTIFICCHSLNTIVDLSRILDHNSVHWPNSKPFVITNEIRQVSNNGEWFANNELAMSEHVGTHIDAPYHFNKNGWKVADIPLNKLIGPGVCIDLATKEISAEQVNHGKHTILHTLDILHHENVHGKIKDGSIVLVKFGWGVHYGSRKYLYDENESDILSFPGISEDAALLLVERGVVGVGVDTASTDKGESSLFEVHKVFAANNIYGIENLDLSEFFETKGFDVMVMPMKIREGTGAPVRVIATPTFQKSQN